MTRFFTTMMTMAVGVSLYSGTALADSEHGADHMMSGAGWIMAPIMMIVVLAIVVFLVVLLVRWLWPGGHSTGSAGNSNDAIRILEERFARGEIEKEEFEEKKHIIGA
jgi:putative membrane protein